ncbi:MAG: NifB/NifX family molybdenum-iron cluster-binding protein [Draconibacterium sp.]
MKRIAIPIANGILSENFGECNYYEVFEVDKAIKSTKTSFLPDEIEISELVAWLKSEGITDVVTHRINRSTIGLFTAEKINLFVGIPIEAPERIIDDYLQGKLESDKKVIAELTGNS